MTDMSENPTEPVPVQEIPAAVVETAPTEVPAAAAPEKKKRGRKPKSALPPPPPAPVLVEPHKPRKRRSAPWVNKSDRAFSVALVATEKERTKCIDELSKIMEMWDVKQARLKSLDWKISNLKGTTALSAIAGMQLQSYAQQPQPAYPLPPQYPQPPAYPSQATAFIPPSMRMPNLPPVPAVPQAGGGAIDTPFEAEEDDPDKFLKVGDVVGDGKWMG